MLGVVLGRRVCQMYGIQKTMVCHSAFNTALHCEGTGRGVDIILAAAVTKP